MINSRRQLAGHTHRRQRKVMNPPFIGPRVRERLPMFQSTGKRVGELPLA